jgi:hypothetical protein
MPHSLNVRHDKVMTSERFLLLIDATTNLLLGVALIFFPGFLVNALGVPTTDSAFYPSILGAVLFGIGVALLLQRSMGGGLGLRGAISINLCGGIALGGWLIFGDLELPFRGFVFLWSLVILLVGISTIEISAAMKLIRRAGSTR